MRYSGFKPNLSLIIGWCVAAVAIGMAAGCNDSQNPPDFEGTGGTAGDPIVTAGVQTTGGTVTTGGNQGTGGTTGGNVGSGGIVGTGGTRPVTGGVFGTGGIVDNGQTGGTVEPSAGAGGEPPVAGAGGDPGIGESPEANPCGTGENATDNVDMEVGPGPFTPTHVTNGPGGAWIFYPEELGRNGCMHPIFDWGPGAGTGPSNYEQHLSHFASHGIVVISSPSSGTGAAERSEIEYMINENDNSGSPFYQKLDTTKIVMGGHSLGALTTLAMAGFEPITHYVLVCGGSGGGGGAANIHGPALYLGGVGEGGTVNFEGDFAQTPTEALFIIKEATDHIMCARNNMAPWTAFLRWQLYGEEQWKGDLFDGGKYCTPPWASCESKNWP